MGSEFVFGMIVGMATTFEDSVPFAIFFGPELGCIGGGLFGGRVWSCRLECLVL